MEQHNTDVSLPSGYTQKTIISYACTNTNSQLKYYEQMGRTIFAGFNNDWRAWTSSATPTGATFVDLSTAIPPIECFVQFNTNQITGTGFTGVGNFTPILTYPADVGSANRITLRGYYAAGNRNGQLYHTYPVLFADSQAMLAYQADTTMTAYVMTITF